MSRITASLTGFERSLLNRLADANAAIEWSALRVASGRRIVAPRNDPSAFVDVSLLRSRLLQTDATASNVAAASSIVSQVQQTLDLIRTQLNTVRTKLVEDEDGALTAEQRTANQSAIDAAIVEINRLAGADIGGRRLLDGSAEFTATGRSYAQVRELTVSTLGGATVVRSAQAAEVIYTGTTDGRIAAVANITLHGNSGNQTLALDTTWSLSQVAKAINAQTGATGVEAEAIDDKLYIRSSTTGATATVQRVLNSGTFAITGGNGAGSAFGSNQVNSASSAIGGRVRFAATRAALTFTGAGGLVTSGNATVTVAGPRGSTSISVTANQTLTSLATTINGKSHKSGVTASVDGNTLTFQSVDYGAADTVAVTATSGTFSVAGGNGDGTANGTDAVVELNGRTIRNTQSAQPARLTHYESTGLLTYATDFSLAGPLGTRPISLSAGATLAAVRDTINVETALTGVTATVSTDGKTLTLTTSATGAAATIDVTVTSGTLALNGGNGDGSANGENAVTSAQRIDGNRVQIVDNALRFSLDLTAGFVGNLNTMTLADGGVLRYQLSPQLQESTTLAIPSLHAALLGGVSGTVDQLFTGGTAAGLGANASLAIRIVDEALGGLTRIEGQVDGIADAAIASSAALMTGFQESLADSIDQIDGVDEAEEELLQARHRALASNALSSLAVLQQQRSGVVELLRQIAGLS